MHPSSATEQRVAMVQPAGFIDGFLDALRKNPATLQLLPGLMHKQAIGVLVHDSALYVASWLQGMNAGNNWLEALTAAKVAQRSDGSGTPIMTPSPSLLRTPEADAEVKQKSILQKVTIKVATGSKDEKVTIKVATGSKDEKEPQQALADSSEAGPAAGSSEKEEPEEAAVKFVMLKNGDGWCQHGVRARELMGQCGYKDSTQIIVGAPYFSYRERKKTVHTLVMYRGDDAVAMTVYRDLLSHQALECCFFCVSKQHRRQGHGRILVEEVVRRAILSGATKMVVDVERSRTAESFWRDGIGCKLLQKRGNEALAMDMVNFGDDVREFYLDLAPP
jgi:ribosomal protein S18 acetylase RimI-like enzyme